VRNRFALPNKPIARSSCIGFIALALICIHAAPAAVKSQINSQINSKINSHDQLTYIWISPGSYLTGCQPGDKECIGWERSRQKITIEQGFWIGQTEVTQAAYQRIMNSNPSRYQGPQRPAEQVDWYSATNYCKRVGMRLPTESEWEYAALGKVQAPRYDALNKIAWYDGNSGDMTHDVAQKQPNAYGLFDMLGNVWEWVEDVCTCDPKRRLMKGGSFYNISRDLRVPNRETPLDTLQHRNIGFRCVANSLP
jgi:formylglycine-generating enzyme required for sulfatase activity